MYHEVGQADDLRSTFGLGPKRKPIAIDLLGESESLDESVASPLPASASRLQHDMYIYHITQIKKGLLKADCCGVCLLKMNSLGSTSVVIYLA